MYIKILVVTAALAIVLSIISPLKAVMIYALVRPLVTPAAFDQVTLLGLPISTPLTVGIIVVALISLPLQRRWRLFAPGSLLLLFVTVLALLSGVQSIDKGVWMAGIVKLAMAWSVLVISYNAVRSQDDAVALYKAIALSAVIPLAYGFFEVSQGLAGGLGVPRISSILGTNNGYGIYLSMVLAATALALLHVETKKARLLYLTLLAAIIASQVLSQNRGSWIALAFGFVVALVRYRRKVDMRWVIIGALALGVFASGVIMSRFEQLEERNPYSRYQNTFVERIEYWKKIVPLVLNRPLLGYGAESSAIVTTKYLGSASPTHNAYLELALEIGVLSALIYALFLAKAALYFWFRRVRDDVWKENFVLIILTVYLPVISVTQHIIYDLVSFPLFLMLVGAARKVNDLTYAAGHSSEAPEPSPLDSQTDARQASADSAPADTTPARNQ